MDDLRERALVLLAKGRTAFGFNDAVLERDLAKTLDPNWQTHLFDMVRSVIRVPDFWSVPRTILEVGCGGGSFVTAGLKQGHDAWGVDNDVDRLAIGYSRIDTFAMDPAWKSRLIQGDASATDFEPDRFDLVLGHQFIEHVPDPAGTIAELLRITKPGGYVVLFAPDYRAPFEAHYEIPWAPFLPRELCKAWLDGFDRPYGGLDMFYYTTASQILGIFEPLNCRIVTAYNDRKIEPQVMRHFDCSTLQATFETARKFRTAFENKSLPENFMIATSFGVAAQKL
ncbi:MAG TPA: class I SAM-dependent methyltransferase [Alphaproteobacteria bacterium]|nr:class I SAM-dependent methyltransferase [Alphaproteobacteria bacterium]